VKVKRPHRQSLLRTILKKSASYGYQRNPLPLLMPFKNRTNVDVESRRRSRFAITALLGLALVRFARASAATTKESSALASMTTQV
jgi:hypothetical protein